MQEHDRFYEAVANEISAGSLDAMTWTKAIAESDGSTEAARRLYIRLRVDALVATESANRAEQKRQINDNKRRAADGPYARGFPYAVAFLIIFTFLFLTRPADSSVPYVYISGMEWLIPFFAALAVRGLIARKRIQT
jgi:hypothetical protein